MSFFRQFPLVPYDLQRRGSKIQVTDLFRNVTAENIKLDTALAYSTYRIINGARPDVVSQLLYGDPDYYWTFFVINDALKSGHGAWPMSAAQLDTYLTQEYDKYGVIQMGNSERNTPIPYRWITTSVGDINSSSRACTTVATHAKGDLDFESNPQVIINAAGTDLRSVMKYDPGMQQIWIINSGSSDTFFSNLTAITYTYYPTLLSNLTASYKFDETSGNRVSSVSGVSTPPLIPTGAAVTYPAEYYGSGLNGNAFQANFATRGTGYLLGTNDSFNPGSNEFCGAVAIKLLSSASDQTIIGRWDNTTAVDNSWRLCYVAATETLEFWVQWGSNPGDYDIVECTNFGSMATHYGEWLRVIFGRQGNVLKCNVNGGTFNEITIGGSTINPAAVTPLTIGDRADESEGMTGLVDDFHWWTGRFLSSAEQTTLQNSGSWSTYPFNRSSGTYTSPDPFFRFSRASYVGSTLTLSTNAIDGTQFTEFCAIDPRQASRIASPGIPCYAQLGRNAVHHFVFTPEVGDVVTFGRTQTVDGFTSFLGIGSCSKSGAINPVTVTELIPAGVNSYGGIKVTCGNGNIQSHYFTDPRGFRVSAQDVLRILTSAGVSGKNFLNISPVNRIVAVTYADYENDLNEKRSSIRVINPAYIRAFVKQYRDLLNA